MGVVRGTCVWRGECVCVRVCVCVCVCVCMKGELTRGPPIPKIPWEAREELSSYMYTCTCSTYSIHTYIHTYHWIHITKYLQNTLHELIIAENQLQVMPCAMKNVYNCIVIYTPQGF